MQPDSTRPKPTLTREVGANTAPLVLLGGAVTIALALAGVWLADRSGQHVMGWYGSHIIPVGAILVGLVASSGFGIASYSTGTKITGLLLFTVTAMLFGGYWLAQYLTFLSAFDSALVGRERISFFDYYDAVTRSFYWVEHGRPGQPLGALGYLLRLGEIVGFTGGGVIIPFALRKLPYCDACRAYKKSPLVARIPAGITWKKVNAKKRPQEAQEQSERAQQALEAGQTKLQAILTAAAKDGAALEQAIADHGPAKVRSVEKLSARIWVHLVHCRRCGQGELRADLVTGQGKQIKRMGLSRTPVDQTVVVAFQRLPARQQRV